MKKQLLTFIFGLSLLYSFSQIANQPNDLILCDDDNDGFSQFDLSVLNTQILGGQDPTVFILSYHLSQMDADNGVSPISSPTNYTNISNPQLIYVRLENGSTGNFDTTTLSLIVNSNPIPNQPSPLELCDDISADGIVEFDLSAANVEIVGGNFNWAIAYYETSEDAMSQSNPLNTIYSSTSSAQTIFVAVTDVNTGCIGFTTLQLIVNPLPSSVAVLPYQLCDSNNPGDEQEQFDLTAKDVEILNGQTNVSVTYYQSQVDADTGTNPIVGLYTNVSNPQQIYATLTNTNTGCYTTTTFTLMVLPTPIANTPQPLIYCDTDNDGFGVFTLTDADNEITGGAAGFTVSYHETHANANNNIDAIDTSVIYNNIIVNSQSLYARVENTAGGVECGATIVELQLIVEPTPQIVQPSPLFVCEDDSLDGFASFEVTAKANEILNGLNPLQYTLSYYETQVDAELGTNAITNTTSYTNITPSMQLLWVRVEDTNSIAGCYNITSMELIVTGQNCGPDSGILMQNGTFTACSGTFFDSGGEFGNYVDNEDYTITICPENDGDTLGLNFTSFTTQLIPDILSIYDGDSTDADLIGSFSGFTSPGLVAASATNVTGCLTITFESNATGNISGWAADIICYESCTDFLSSIDVTNQTISNSGVVSIALGETVSFSGSISSASDEPSVSYNWNFGDGNSAIGAEVSHDYLDEGLYEVTLEVIDENASDCSEIETISVVVTDENVVVYPTEFTVEELIADVFLASDCSQVFNVTYSTGLSFNPSEPNGITYFASSGENFPFSEGLVLTTGDAATAGGPNDVGTSSQGSNNWPGDADLDNTIPGVQSYNATVIEFDFIPVINEISFDFLMASDEYDGGSFECAFSDAFAFLLTDAQGNTTNLAVIPGTDTPILVTNVHPDNGSCPAENEDYFGGYVPEGSPPIAFNGMTTLLTAQSEVNIGESYHIKLVIADDRDTLYDSAVFLRAGSLDIGELCNDIGLINTKAFKDDNSNGVLDLGELDFTQGYFTYEKNNDGVINNVNTNIGNFSIVSDNESDTYDITFNIYDEYSSCYMPVTSTMNTVSVLNGNITTIDFLIVDNEACEDLAVYLINPFEAPRPGFDYSNQLIIENLGNSAITSGSIEVNLDSSISFNEIIDMNPNYSLTVTSSGFTLDFVNLEVGATEIIDISLNCNVATVLDDTITNSLTYITDENDLFSTNNTAELTEVVIGSYDPNDIFESHGSEIIYDDFITSDEYLYYTIRFQNVGTAKAIFVRIEDELDAQLDETTFQMLRASHNYTVTRTGSSLEWFFDDINLPAEQDDAEGSNGYVYFKIKPKAGYGLGDIIPNLAAIYFDFNAPIITNTFNTTFVEPLAIEEFNKTIFSVYPNPTKDKVTISLKDRSMDDFDITLKDVQGKIINIASEIENGSIVFDVSFLHAGLYFIQLKNANGNHIEKLIVE